MTEALRTVLPLAIAIAIFPVPIIAAVLLTVSERGRTKCLAFVIAWCAGLASVCAIALLVADTADASDGGEPATWANAIVLAIGLACLATALYKWRRRPVPGEEAPAPGWMRTIDDFTIARSATAGLALTALNPKNVALAVAAATEIAAFGLDSGEQTAAVLSFVLVASLGVLSPLVISLAGGARSRNALDGLKGWMARWNTVIMTALFALIGLKLVADVVLGFA